MMIPIQSIVDKLVVQIAELTKQNIMLQVQLETAQMQLQQGIEQQAASNTNTNKEEGMKLS